MLTLFLNTLTFLLHFTGIAFSLSDDIKFGTVSVDLSSLIYDPDELFFEIIVPEELSYTYKIQKAKNFGGTFTRTLSKINLVMAEPYHGCNTLYNSQKIKDNIALVKRGECSFLSKALQVEQAGAVGIIITDNNGENDDTYIEMVGDETEKTITIPAVFLLGKNGRVIEYTLRKKNLEHAIINIPVNLTHVPDFKRNQPPWIRW